LYKNSCEFLTKFDWQNWIDQCRSAFYFKDLILSNPRENNHPLNTEFS